MNGYPEVKSFDFSSTDSVQRWTDLVGPERTRQELACQKIDSQYAGRRIGPILDGPIARQERLSS